MSVLGALLIDNEALYRIDIKREDFYRPAHGKIFDAILDLSGRMEPCDLITLTDTLKRRGDLDACGGAAYLATLVDYVPTAANITYYANIVKNKALARHVLSAATKLAADSYSEDADPHELLNRAQAELFAIDSNNCTKSEPAFARDLIAPMLASFQQRYEQKSTITGLETGFPGLDKMTAGLHPGDLIIIAARPSMGKTVLGVNIADRVARNGKKAAVFSLEMSKEQLMARISVSLSGVDMDTIKRGNFRDGDWQSIQRAMARLHKSELIIDDTPSLSIQTLRSKCRKLAAQVGLSLIVVDYLQLMTSDGKFENRQQEISNISRALKGLAKELNVPVIALSQLNRSLESRADKRPMLSDLRESGAIEQDADIIMFLYREAVYCEKCRKKDGSCTEGHERTTELLVEKHRNGATGILNLIFNGEHARFDSAISREDRQ
jgi:replicative DNA helicase